jgi:hypothetical protein
MVLCIAAGAVFIRHFQVYILYAIPLTLLACYRQVRALRWVTLVAIAFTFITYFVKYWLIPPESGPQFLSYRIVNRSMVIGMLWLLSRVLEMWLEADHCRPDRQSSVEFDRAHTQISAMLGMLIAMPTIVVIALLDALIPGQFNLAVFYAVPLITCAWTRNARLLWTLFVLLQVLAIGGLYWGPQPYGPDAFRHALQNRVLDGAMMLVVAGLLHYWIRAMRQGGQAPLSDTRGRPVSPDGDDDHVFRGPLLVSATAMRARNGYWVAVASGTLGRADFTSVLSEWIVSPPPFPAMEG